MASESSLMIKRFAPASTIAHEIYEDWPITIDVEGTYHNLALFFDRVSRLSVTVEEAMRSIISCGAGSAKLLAEKPVDTPPS